MRMRIMMCIALLGLLALPVLAQEAPADDSQQAGKMSDSSAKETKKAKQGRWEGIVVRSNKDKKTLTVRQRSSGLEKTVMYDDSTKFTSQEHGSKKVNDIDAGQVNDNDRIICLGEFDKDGVLHATMISKRLTQH